MNKSVAVIGTRGYPSFYGGFETAVRKLCPFLADSGWEVTVYGRPGATLANFHDRDERIRSVKTIGMEKKAFSTLSYGATAVLHAVFLKPDVALVMNVANGFWLPILKARRIPTVVNVDGMEWERAKWGRIARAVFKLGARMTARFADEIVADSEEIARRWEVEFGRESTFIPYGGDVPEKSGPALDLGHGQYILLVARFVPENTIEEFFDAAKALAENHPVVLVGSSGYGGPLERQALQLSREFHNISWLGHISDDNLLSRLWQHAGVYFHGHSVGGTNPALLQAMAAGAPVVARDTPYNREVLGTSGIFVGATSAEIASAISLLMKDPNKRQMLQATALERIHERYTWQLVCRAYDDLLRLAAKARTTVERSH
ncbi:DUF1972 domain-containing protein [Arthrobacter cheniae]|uniref:DUF1972 domain-containing protein n=1 Tax=Arthrobacter cheniae TaxID=1258888 RepID=A0A3A5M382_9MICC|nr:glycosyltransferase [Arthrobacter cheniae]RJT80916.1 DUF1972 domain-containing protein [Arthrobacter cheniae]